MSTVVAADAKFGPDTTLDSLAISGGMTNYLISWRDLRNGPNAPRITGAIVSNTGTQTPDFPISDVGGLPIAAPVQRAMSAFDNTNYLVIWVDNRASGAGIRGAFVTQQGTVVGGADFLIAPVSTLNNNNPQVVFAASDYFVAWQDSPAGSASGTQIFYSRVSLTGAAGAPIALPQNSASSGLNQSLEFLVRGAASEVLIVYQDFAAQPAASYGARIASDNTIAGTGQTQLFKREIADSGFGVPVAAGYDGTQYVVLSSFGAQIDSTVFQTRFRTDGTLLRPAGSFAEVAQGATGLVEDAFPRAIYNPTISNVQITPSIQNTTAVGEWLFPRNIKASDTAYHIFIERVLSDGTNRDLNPVPLDAAQQGILNGAVAAAIGTQYLIVWQDGRRLAQQPGAGANVYGVLYDDTQLGDVTKPFLKAVARAAPLSGTAPLLVQLVGDSSTGSVDSLGWDFGDGSTPSTTLSPTHTYTADGTYLAVLSLRRFGYQLHDFVRIVVGGTLLGGGGGPPQATAGTLGPLSAGVNSNFAFNNLNMAVDFTKQNSDQLRFLGYFDPSVLPISVNGLSGSLTIGTQTYTFSLDSTGKVVVPSGGANLTFNINIFNGATQVTTSADNLATLLAAAGAGNESDPKPGKDVTLPVTFTFGSLNWQANVTGKYIATAGKKGNFTCQFGVTGGTADTGLIRVNAAAASEGGKAPTRTDTFGVNGIMGPATNSGVLKADSGNWTISLGNYTEAIPVNLLTTTGKSTLYTYKPPTGKTTGILSFQYDSGNGRFAMQIKNIPAEGDAASGLPLTTSTANRADMALSFDLATPSGTDFQASVYVRLIRKKAGSKKWVLR